MIMLQAVHCHKVLLVLALWCAALAPAAAQTDCAAETAGLERLVAGVRVSMNAPPDLKAGGTIDFSWTAPERFPLKVPVYLVIAVPGEVRFVAPALVEPPKPADDTAEANPAPQLPGFIALPPKARGPLGIAFGQESSRALIPLYQPASKLSGSAGVRVFDAGPLPVAVNLVARTACGERVISANYGGSLTVKPGTPEIVVQDPFDIEQPKQILLSNSGRYRIHIFDGRYRVFDIATGAKLVDRAGHDPNFSPTSRYVVATIGDKGSWTYEVIDLVSREVVAQPAGQFIGWTHDDAFMIAGSGSWGALRVRPMLMSRPGVITGSAADAVGDGLEFAHPGSCHACRAWKDDTLMLDLDNGVLAFTSSVGFTEVGPVYELASGSSLCCQNADEIKDFVAQNYAVSSFSLPKGWHAREPIEFSQGLDPAHDWGGEPDPEAAQLLDQIVGHKPVDPKAAPVAVAQITGPTIVRGDWRQNTGRGDVAQGRQSLGQRITSELARFELVAAPPLAHEQIAFNNSGLSPDVRAKWVDGTTEAQQKRIDDRIARRTTALEKRLLHDVPVLRPHLSHAKIGSDEYLVPLPLEGLAKAKIQLEQTLEGMWRWQLGGQPVWLAQLWATEGNGGVGEGMMFLFEGDATGAAKSGGKIVDLSKILQNFWSGQYGTSNQQSQIKPQLYLDRYLVMASVAAGTIAVYDLRVGKVIALFKDIPQADLLDEVQLSADARHVIQINSDGQFFIHDIASSRTILSGRAVDDEIIVYTPQGYYWSSYEGAHFVQLRFPGLAGLYPFQQFASALDRPDLIKAALMAGANGPASPSLQPPPVLELAVSKTTPDRDSLTLQVSAHASAPLARLALFADGHLIAQRPLSGTATTLDVSVPRSPNTRWLTAQVIDTKGFQSIPQAIRLRPTAAPTSVLHAVLVGINSYSNPKFDLEFARQDAERLGAALQSTAGETYGRVDVTRLLDADATREAILSALSRTVSSAAPEDTIIFAFSGHGVQTHDGRYYLTTTSFDFDQLAATGLTWTDVSAVLRQAKARVIVILDACHAGLSGTEGLGTNDDAIGAISSGARTPMLVLAASKGRQSSLEGAQWGGGVFTDALVRVLQTKRSDYDVDHDGAIEVSELYRALKTIVSRETKGQQTPWLVRQDLIGDFSVF